MTSVVVTGAGGFIGRQVVAELRERGAQVHALVRQDAGDAADGVQHHSVDLLGASAPVRRLFADIGATHLVHLAWYAVPGTFWTSPENERWIDATAGLARAFRESGGVRMVSAGSCAEYAPGPLPCVEDRTPLAPATPYGVAKDATRRLLESCAEQSGLSVAWARIFFLYGPGEHSQRLVPAVINALLRGRAPECSAGAQVRDYLHVRDVAAAFVDALFSDAAGPLNVCSGQPVSVREVVEAIARQFPGGAAPRFGAVPSRDESAYIVGDATRLRSTVGWEPSYDLESGLRDAIAWWRDR